jgi:hypothetical protein
MCDKTGPKMLEIQPKKCTKKLTNLNTEHRVKMLLDCIKIQRNQKKMVHALKEHFSWSSKANI